MSFRTQLILIIIGLSFIHNFFNVLKETTAKDSKPKKTITEKTTPTEKKSTKPSSDNKTYSTTLPNGFSKYTWGTNRSTFTELILQNGKDRDNKIYTFFSDSIRNIAPELIGNINPQKVYVNFNKDKLTYVVLEINDDYYGDVMSFMSTKFGASDNSTKDNTVYLRWEDKDTLLLLIHNPRKNYFHVQSFDKRYHK